MVKSKNLEVKQLNKWFKRPSQAVYFCKRRKV